MNEEKAVAILLANLKKSKKKPTNLIDIAQAIRILKKQWGLQKMTEFFTISSYQLRQIDKINDLDEKTKDLIQKGKLGIEASYQLWRLDSKRRKDAITYFKNMTTDEIRGFVYFIKKNPSLSVDECKKAFDKVRDTKFNVLMIPVESIIFNELTELSKKYKMNVHDYALKIIKTHLKMK
jgi:hypothetical protein